MKTLVGSILKNAQSLTTISALYDYERGRLYTWHDVAKKVMQGAGRLRLLGVCKGSRVVIHLPDCADAVLAYYAVHAAGGIAVPVRWPASETYLAYVKKDCSPKLTITPSTILTRGDLTNLATGDRTVLQDIADIVYTSGSSGKPKGATLSHYNIASLALNNNFAHSRVDDYELICANWAHTFALGRIRTWPKVGNKLVVMNSSELGKALHVLSGFPRVTGLVMTVPAFEMLRRRHHLPILNWLQYIEMAAGRPTKALQQELVAWLPYARIVHHYGCTEAPYATYRLIGVDPDDAGCVGRAAPCVQIDFDARTRDHREQGVGEVGITGGMVMLGYWGDKVCIQETLEPRTFWTGDIGYKDKDGLLFIEGRIDDMIYSLGEKVWPAKVEDILRQHPTVLEVAVIGVPDPRGIAGQVPIAIIKMASPDLGLRAWCKERLEPHEVPRRFESLDELPRTPAGKIDKKELLRDYQDCFEG